MTPMNCAMTCGYQFNFLFVVELDVSVFHDMKPMKVIPKPRAVQACQKINGAKTTRKYIYEAPLLRGYV